MNNDNAILKSMLIYVNLLNGLFSLKTFKLSKIGRESMCERMREFEVWIYKGFWFVVWHCITCFHVNQSERIFLFQRAQRPKTLASL